MNRRRFLTGMALCIPIGIGGCLGRADTPLVPDEMRVETQYQVGSHIVDAGISPSGPRPRSYQTIITDRPTAQQRFTDNEAITEFVQSTAFDQSYLVAVVAAAWPSAYWLKLVEVERLQTGLRLHIFTQSPEDPVGDDAAVHSLVIRITDDQHTVPNRIEVELNNVLTGTATAG